LLEYDEHGTPGPYASPISDYKSIYADLRDDQCALVSIESKDGDMVFLSDLGYLSIDRNDGEKQSVMQIMARGEFIELAIGMYKNIVESGEYKRHLT